MEKSKNFLNIQYEDLNVNEIIKTANFFESGSSINLSTVFKNYHCNSDNPNYKEIKKIKYEADEMEIMNDFNIICEKVRVKWNVDKILIFHRLGEVLSDKPSVVIAVSSCIQLESNVAVQFILNAVKSLTSISTTEIFSKSEICTTNVTDKDSINFNHNNNHFKEKFSKVKTEHKIVDLDSEPSKYDPEFLQSSRSASERKDKIKKLLEHRCYQRNKMNILKNYSFCKAQNNDDHGIMDVCARSNIIFSGKNIVRRVVNNWSDPYFKKSYAGKFVTESSVLDEKPINERPVPKGILEKLKNIEDRLLALKSEDPRYMDCLRINRYQKDSVNELDLKTDNKKLNEMRSVLDERLSWIENLLGVDKLQNIQERLETAEEHLLYLESCVPEYIFKD